MELDIIVVHLMVRAPVRLVFVRALLHKLNSCVNSGPPLQHQLLDGMEQREGNGFRRGDVDHVPAGRYQVLEGPCHRRSSLRKGE